MTHYDYGFRIYNPSIGKFLSVDPLTKSYPMLTPYQFASNRPIDGVDLDGLEWVGTFGLDTYRGNPFNSKTSEEFVKKNIQSWTPRLIGAGIGAAGVATIYTGGQALPFVKGIFYRTATFTMQHPELVAGAGAFAAGIIDPNPANDYPGNFDDFARGVKLLLGKSHVIGKYAEEMSDAYHMFKDGFGLDIPKVIPLSSQILRAMYQTIDEGGKIVFDLKDVSKEIAKKGFKNFEEAAEVAVDGTSKITEWELSKILRDPDLFKNTVFKDGDKISDGAGAGLKLIDE